MPEIHDKVNERFSFLPDVGRSEITPEVRDEREGEAKRAIEGQWSTVREYTGSKGRVFFFWEFGFSVFDLVVYLLLVYGWGSVHLDGGLLSTQFP